MHMIVINSIATKFHMNSIWILFCCEILRSKALQY